MAILTVNNIKKMFGTDVIIQDITFEVQKGDRIGLVGINGSGKTTLFKVLNGEYTADEGTFTPARETSIGYMEQHVCRDMEKPAFDEVMTVFAPLLKMEAEIEVLTTKISEMPENLNELIEKQAELNDRFIADLPQPCKKHTHRPRLCAGADLCSYRCFERRTESENSTRKNAARRIEFAVAG